MNIRIVEGECQDRVTSDAPHCLHTSLPRAARGVFSKTSRSRHLLALALRVWLNSHRIAFITAPFGYTTSLVGGSPEGEQGPIIGPFISLDRMTHGWRRQTLRKRVQRRTVQWIIQNFQFHVTAPIKEVKQAGLVRIQPVKICNQSELFQT